MLSDDELQDIKSGFIQATLESVEDIRGLIDEIQALKKDLAEKEALIAKGNKLQDEIDAARIAVDVMDDVVNELRAHVTTLQISNRKLRDQVAGITSDLEEDQIQALREEIKVLKAQLNLVTGNIDTTYDELITHTVPVEPTYNSAEIKEGAMKFVSIYEEADTATESTTPNVWKDYYNLGIKKAMEVVKDEANLRGGSQKDLCELIISLINQAKE